MYFYDQTILLAEKSGKEKNILGMVHGNKAIILSESGMDFLSLSSFEKAYEAFLAVENKSNIALCGLNLAELNKELKNYDEAINLAMEILKDTVTLADETGKANANSIIGASLIKAGNPEKSLPFLEIADSLGRSKNTEDHVTINERTWMAHAYLDLGNPKRAIRIGENIKKEFPNFQGSVMLVDLILGKALLQEGQIKRAIRVLEGGLARTGTKDDQIAIIETLGHTHLSQNMAQKS